MTDPSGAVLLQSVFLFISFGAPFLWMALVAALWACPMQSRTQANLLTISEWLFAWSAHDVLVLTLLVAPPQLPPYFRHLLARDCAQINPILEDYFSGLLHGDPTCLSVSAATRSGVWLLCGSAIISILAGLACTRLCRLVLPVQELA